MTPLLMAGIGLFLIGLALAYYGIWRLLWT